MNRAIDFLEKENYNPRIINDISSKITILYLSSISKSLPTEATASAKLILDKIIKEALND